MAVSPQGYGSPYLLDTNIVGYVAGGQSPAARVRLAQALADSPVLISTITQAEILYGLEKKAEAKKLRASVIALLETLQITSWDGNAAVAYAKLRSGLGASGKSLSLMDLLIASQALAVGAILVSHDRAFQHLAPFLTVSDWATDL